MKKGDIWLGVYANKLNEIVLEITDNKIVNLLKKKKNNLFVTEEKNGYGEKYYCKYALNKKYYAMKENDQKEEISTWIKNALWSI